MNGPVAERGRRNAKGGMKPQPKKDITRIMVEDGDLILEALKQGVREAMIRHKQAGLPVVICDIRTRIGGASRRAGRRR